MTLIEELREHAERCESVANWHRSAAAGAKTKPQENYHHGKADGFAGAAEFARERIAELTPRPALRLISNGVTA